MSAMPTKKPILNFVVDDKLLRRIDNFRFDKRMNSRSEAVRRLIEESLDRYEKGKKIKK